MRRAAGDADDRAARVRVPPRAAEAGEGGHEEHAAVVGHRLRRAGRSRPASAMTPSPSRSHCTAAPVTKIAPSSAYATVPSASVHATVVSMPSAGGGHVGADVQQHEAAGAVGVLGHARLRSRPGRTGPPAGRRRCRRSGCRPARRSASAVTPKRPLDGRTSGSAAIGTSNRSHISVAPRSVRMSNSIVRLALRRVGGVHLAAGEVPEQPRVDGADREVVVDRDVAVRAAATRPSCR